VAVVLADDFEAAEELVERFEAAEELVDRLVTAQLVEVATVQGRYRLHALLRLFATEQLDKHETDTDRETRWANLAQATSYLAYKLGVALEPLGLHPELDDETRITPEVALDWLEAEREGMIAVAERAVERGPWSEVGSLAERLSDFLELRGYWEDEERLTRWALQTTRQDADRMGEAKALNNLGLVLANQGHWDQAIDHYQQSLAIKQELGDRHGEARTLGNLGSVLARQGRSDQARDHWHAALAIFERLRAPETATIVQALAQLDQPRRRRWWPFPPSRSHGDTGADL
jgi:tetratricopeptide (TPR) repeat protein